VLSLSSDGKRHGLEQIPLNKGKRPLCTIATAGRLKYSETIPELKMIADGVLSAIQIIAYIISIGLTRD